ncbi:unnamed protein product [Lathyrus sativus]|nr:unnamed protein product [Lathyrus sativus]
MKINKAADLSSISVFHPPHIYSRRSNNVSNGLQALRDRSQPSQQSFSRDYLLSKGLCLISLKARSMKLSQQMIRERVLKNMRTLQGGFLVCLDTFFQRTIVNHTTQDLHPISWSNGTL